ncbi:MAG: alpha/beta fold hydrolase [Bacteroidales bacterium]|nr:alpha/beta fold hydrolase [Bacteroidales bacterium]
MCNKDLFFRDFGNGNPIIILHGFLGSSDIWVPLARILSIKNKVIILDLPNHGNSYHTNTLDYKSTSAIIEEFIASNMITNPIVIGHSYGGKIALQLIANSIINIKKLVVIDITSQEQKDSEMKNLVSILSKPLPCFSSFNEANEYFLQQVGNAHLAQLLCKGLKRNNKTLVWKWNTGTLTTQYPEILKPIHIPLQCDTPMLLIKGEKSDYVKDEGKKELERIFTNFTLSEIKNAGHWVHADNFDAFVKAIEHFITENTTP